MWPTKQLTILELEKALKAARKLGATDDTKVRVNSDKACWVIWDQRMSLLDITVDVFAIESHEIALNGDGK